MSEELYVKAECVPETLPAGLTTSIGLVSSPMTGTSYAGFWPLAAIDLSAPPLDGAGMPTRMDALPWALSVLVHRGAALKLSPSSYDFSPMWPEGCPSWWPDPEPDDFRPIVAAALRARVGLPEVSP